MRLCVLVVLLTTAVAHAQAMLTGPSPVEVTGTVGVGNRVDASVTTAPGTAIGVYGLDGTDVRVELNATSLATLTAASGKGNCTYVNGSPAATLTTATSIPASPLSGRTALTVWNHSTGTNAYLVCSANGTATATNGIRIESGNQWFKWEGLSGTAPVTVSCLCHSGTCTYGYLEEKCYQ